MPIVSIIGVGMMGGSLGLALRRKKSARVIGVGRNLKKLSLAKSRGACDEVTTDLSRGVSKSDVVVICTAVSQIIPALHSIIPHLKPGTIVTDIGSVKSKIMDGARDIFSSPKAVFIGAHPLAGSEKTGVQNADAHLYKGATVVLCPSEGASNRAVQVLRVLWKSVGAGTVVMSPEVHDLLVAQTSHLPHVLSAALVQMISGLSRRDNNTPRLLAGSFRDLTRISDSAPEQWAEICGSNQKFVLGALKSYRDILSRCIQNAERESSSWLSFFGNARKARARLLAKKS